MFVHDSEWLTVHAGSHVGREIAMLTLHVGGLFFFFDAGTECITPSMLFTVFVDHIVAVSGCVALLQLA